MSDELDKAFDSNMNGDKNNLRVTLINPPIDNPWATRQDYLDDQKRITTAQRWTIAAAMAAIISSICSVALTYSELRQEPLKTEQAREAPLQPLKNENTTQKAGQK